MIALILINVVVWLIAAFAVGAAVAVSILQAGGKGGPPGPGAPMTEPLVVIPYPGCGGEPIVVPPHKSVSERLCEYHNEWNRPLVIDGMEIPWNEAVVVLRELAKGAQDEP